MKCRSNIYSNTKLAKLLAIQSNVKMAVFKFTNGVFIIPIFSWQCTKERFKVIKNFISKLLESQTLVNWIDNLHLPVWTTVPKISYDFESFKARKNFEGKGKKTFDLKEFRKAPIRIVYDTLHGISTVGIHRVSCFAWFVKIYRISYTRFWRIRKVRKEPWYW